MWWKFGLSMAAIAAAFALCTLEGIASSAGSDSCSGCDSTPAWVNPLSIAAGIAVVIWIAALVLVLLRRA